MHLFKNVEYLRNVQPCVRHLSGESPQKAAIASAKEVVVRTNGRGHNCTENVLLGISDDEKNRGQVLIEFRHFPEHKISILNKSVHCR